MRALSYGLATALGAFAAMAAALWGPASIKLTGNAYIWLGIGSLLPGIVAFFLARSAAKDRQGIDTDRERSGRLLQTLEKEIKGAGAERGNTARALSRLGGAIMQIIRAPDSDRSSDIARFEQLLVQLLWFTLDKRLDDSSPVRVMFLVRHGGSVIGQPEPQVTDDGLAPIVYHARSLAGFHDDQAYTIRKASPEEVFARRLLAQEPGLNYGLLIEDVAGKHPEECPLLPVGDDIMSYCRVAVRDPIAHHGVLCVDAWEPNSLNKGDREVIGAFAAILAVGLTLGIPDLSRERGQPLDSVVPSIKQEGRNVR